MPDQQLQLASRDPRRARRAVRDSIDGAAHLQAVVDIAGILRSGMEPLLSGATGEYEEQPISSVRVAMLAKTADLHLAVLRKVLPDLRALEHSGPEGEPLPAGADVDELVLLTKLQRFVAERGTQALSAPIQTVEQCAECGEADRHADGCWLG